MAMHKIVPREHPSPIMSSNEDVSFACGNEEDFKENKEVLTAFVQFLYESVRRQSARQAWLFLRQFEPVEEDSDELHLSSILRYLDQRQFQKGLELFTRAFISYTGKGDEPITFNEFADLLAKFS